MASRSSGCSAISLSRQRLGLVGALERVEIDRQLDLGVAAQRRIRRHALIDLDRELRLLHLLVEVGEREQRQRMVRREIERELQIDEAEVLAAAAAERRAEAVEHLGGAGLRRCRRAAAARRPRLEIVHRVDDQRMARQHLVERLVDLQRLFLVADCATAAAVGLATRSAVGRACGRARGACRLPSVAGRDRGSGRHAGP